MNYTNLSIDQSPPIATPVRFFLTAPLFALAASLLLLFTGPEIILNRWLPETLAITHLFTLGFISMSMMGALFQLLPVLAGSGIHNAAFTSKLVHRLYTAGVVLLVMGLALSHTQLLYASLIVLVPGILTFLINVTISLIRAKSSHASVLGMRLATASLWLAVIMGATLLVGHAFEGFALYRQYTTVHIAWASIGWIAILIISIAYQVIPMFQVTNEYPEIIKKWLTPMLFTGILGWSLFHYFQLYIEWLNQLIVFIFCILFIIFISITFHLLLQRKKKLADPTLYFWLFGLTMLPVSLLVFFYSIITGHDLYMLAGLLFFFGFAISIINGMLYKILPFLVWLHLNQQLAFSIEGRRKIPTMNEIIPVRYAYHQFYLHLVAIGCLILAVFYPRIFFYPAAVLFMINWLLLECHLVQAINNYKTCLKSNKPD